MERGLLPGSRQRVGPKDPEELEQADDRHQESAESEDRPVRQLLRVRHQQERRDGAEREDDTSSNPLFALDGGELGERVALSSRRRFFVRIGHGRSKSKGRRRIL